MARRSVDPQEVIDELHTQLQPSQDIVAALNEVAGSPAGQFLKDDITRMSLVCGDNALQDGKTEFWSGVKVGLGYILSTMEVFAVEYSDAIAAANERLDKKETEVDPLEDDYQPHMAISHLGNSPL